MLGMYVWIVVKKDAGSVAVVVDDILLVAVQLSLISPHAILTPPRFM
jgi:hypothetical protein